MWRVHRKEGSGKMTGCQLSRGEQKIPEKPCGGFLVTLEGGSESGPVLPNQSSEWGQGKPREPAPQVRSPEPGPVS